MERRTRLEWVTQIGRCLGSAASRVRAPEPSRAWTNEAANGSEGGPPETLSNLSLVHSDRSRQ